MSYRNVSLAFLEGAEHPPGRRNFDDMFGPDNWPLNNSSFGDYCFFATRMGLKNVYARIADRLRELGDAEANTALDLAGGKDGVALQDLIRAKLIARGILTNLLDQRSDDVRDNPELPIEHVDGDLIEQQTWERILSKAEAIAPSGLSLITWLPGGVALSKLSPAIYRGAIHACLDMLRPGGVYLGEIPDGLRFSSELGSVCTSIRERPDVELLDPALGPNMWGSALILKNLNVQQNRQPAAPFPSTRPSSTA